MPEPQITQNPTKRWEGEACRDCRHSIVFHVSSKGICTHVNCDCFKFVPSGKETERVN